MTCPECAGPAMPGHPAGVLAIRHSTTCALRAAEDGTAANDHDVALSYRVTRPATATERLLLAHLGYAVPAVLHTQVTPITTSVLSRTWPGLARRQETTP